MNQFETIAVPARIPGERLGGRASLLVRGDRLWRLVPALFVLAAYALPVLAALAALASPDSGSAATAARGGTLERLAYAGAGLAGTQTVAAIVAALAAAGVWLLARAIDAPRWAAALASSAMVVAPVLGLAPAPAGALDDAAFGAMLAVSAGLALRAGRSGRDGPLALAFVAATLAAALRPGAAWPAFAVVLAAYALLRAKDERLVYGLIASLAWAPGVALFRRAFEMDSDSPMPAALLEGSVRSGVQAVAGWGDVLAGLGLVVPFAFLAAAGAAGLAVGLRPRKGIAAEGIKAQNAAAGAALFICVALLGALGAGGLQAGRLALDPLLWGAAAALAPIAPAVARWIRSARAKRP